METILETTLDNAQAVRALSALAQGTRLALFRELVAAGKAGLAPGTLSQRLEVPAATLSFHLKELNHADLVHVKRSGRSLIYQVNFERMGALLAFLTAHCCGGEPERCGLPGVRECV